MRQVPPWKFIGMAEFKVGVTTFHSGFKNWFLSYFLYPLTVIEARNGVFAFHGGQAPARLKLCV